MAFIDPVGRFLGLPPAVTRRVAVSRALPVRMRDGTILRTDHYAPGPPTASGRPSAPLGRPAGSDRAGAPTVLVRTPYGRGVPTNLLCRAVAQRGFHVVVQSCRGTGDSGGVFEPMLDERADGLDTVDWIKRQPWYDGRLFTYGPSYVGFTQWAVADAIGEQLKGMATIVTASDFGRPTYAGGAFSLDTVLTWASLLAAQRGPRRAAAMELLRGQPRLREGLAHLPLIEADRVAIGDEVTFFQHWLAEGSPSADYWTERGHSRRIAEITAPILMIGGWYDIFLPWQLQDYAALRAAGARPYLTIGPWTHGSLGLFKHSAAESIAFFRATDGLRAQPVRVHLGGADVWRGFPDWPPPGAAPQRWLLLPEGRLDRSSEPGRSEPGRSEQGYGELAAFRYDPADPTPALGGPRLIGTIAGVRDNREHEARADVRTFTSEPLTRAVDAVGPVHATLRVRAEKPYFDVFVRLCDVDPDGHSWNVCDGLTRISGAQDGDEVRVEMWPTAYRFRTGHRIRVQVSGGAHPRFARNPGTGAALGEPSELVPVRRSILSPSSITLTLV